MLQVKAYISPNHLHPTVMSLSTKILSVLILAITTISCDCNRLPILTPAQKDTPSEGLVREKGKGSPGGIPNLGATCYMNSVLQILKSFYLPKINEKHDELGKSLQALMQIIADDKEVANKAEAMAVFKALGAPLKWTTNEHKQMDAEELLSEFFNWMELPPACTECKFIKPITYEERPAGNDYWLIHQVTLPTEKSQPLSMQDLFNQSIAPGLVRVKFRDGDINDSEVQEVKEIKNLDNLYNKILVLQLERFETKGGARLADGTYSDFSKSKLDQSIQNPMRLSIEKDQTIEKDRDRNYMLVGFIQHSGAIDSGHYVAYVKKETRWVCYNDDKVNVVTDTEAEENAKKAYLFFYQPSPSQSKP